MTGVEKVTVQAPGKVNLTLEVLGKREDGYHEIASVMQTISLFDTLTFLPSDEIKVLTEIRRPGDAGQPGLSSGHAPQGDFRSVGTGGDPPRKADTLGGGAGWWQQRRGCHSPGSRPFMGTRVLREARTEGIGSATGVGRAVFRDRGDCLGGGEGGTGVECEGCLRRCAFVLAFPDHRLENKTATAYRDLEPHRPHRWPQDRRPRQTNRGSAPKSPTTHSLTSSIESLHRYSRESTDPGLFCRRHRAGRSIFRGRAQRCFVGLTGLNKVK